MLMKTRQIDFHAVDANHWEIDARLVNWARWVKPGRQSWVSPMFAQYRSKAWQWERPEVKDPINTLDAMLMEKMVGALPDKHRTAIRWAYVVRCTPAIVFRFMGVNADGLMEYLHDARQMLKNRLHRG
jgi:DNA-directed RNA polymerase specialized sigma24 family protein